MNRNFWAGKWRGVRGSVVLLIVLSAAGLVDAQSRSILPGPAGASAFATLPRQAPTAAPYALARPGLQTQLKAKRPASVPSGNCSTGPVVKPRKLLMPRSI